MVLRRDFSARTMVGNTTFGGLSIARRGSSMVNIRNSGILECRGRADPDVGNSPENRRRSGHDWLQAASQRWVRRSGLKNPGVRRSRRGPGNCRRDCDGGRVLARIEPAGNAPPGSDRFHSIRRGRSSSGQIGADASASGAITNNTQLAIFGCFAECRRASIGRRQNGCRPQCVFHAHGTGHAQGIRRTRGVRRRQRAWRAPTLLLPQTSSLPRSCTKTAFQPARRPEEAQVAAPQKANDCE
jgi:hypothetical protein